MRILLTGAGGFVGSHVGRQLIHENHEVYGLVRSHSARERVREYLDERRIFSIDLEKSCEVQTALEEIKPECAIHLAWYAEPGKFWRATDNLDCVQWSLALAKSLTNVGCRRLLIAGTCAEYDWRYGLLSEDSTPCVPQSLYGASKYGLYLVLEQFCKLQMVELAWLRFFYLYGPGEPYQRLVPSIALSLLSNGVAGPVQGELVRDFLHVKDAAAAVCAIAKSSLIGPINIGSGEPTTIKSIAETIERLLSCVGRVSFDSRHSGHGEPPMVVADVRKLSSLAAWTPQYPHELGLANAVEWLQSTGWDRKPGVKGNVC